MAGIRIILTVREAKVLYGRIQQHTGVKKSQTLLKAEEKLSMAIKYSNA